EWPRHPESARGLYANTVIFCRFMRYRRLLTHDHPGPCPHSRCRFFARRLEPVGETDRWRGRFSVAVRRMLLSDLCAVRGDLGHFASAAHGPVGLAVRVRQRLHSYWLFSVVATRLSGRRPVAGVSAGTWYGAAYCRTRRHCPAWRTAQPAGHGRWRADYCLCFRHLRWFGRPASAPAAGCGWLRPADGPADWQLQRRRQIRYQRAVGAAADLRLARQSGPNPVHDAVRTAPARRHSPALA